MEIIGDNTSRTSLIPTCKVVQCRGEQHKYWLELQFVDENNSPVSGLNVRLEYHPLASAEQVAMWKKYQDYDCCGQLIQDTLLALFHWFSYSQGDTPPLCVWGRRVL